MAAITELVPEPILDRDGVKVSKSPWGPDDEIGRLNWITPETNTAILEHLDGAHVFDLNVEYFIGMPSWVAAGDPPYGIWMTHTPQGSINDNLSGVGSARPREVLVLRRLDPPVHALRHAHRHAQPPRPLRAVLERLDGGQGPRQPHLEQGRPRQVPADHRARRAARRRRHARRRLPARTATRSRRRTSRTRRAKQGVELQPKRRRARPHRPHDRVARLRRLPRSSRPGLDLAAAKWLCEEMGAMCIGADTIALEVLPSEEPDVFLPGARVHVRDRRRADHRGRGHGGDRGREAVRVRVPRLPAQAARRDRRADAVATRCRSRARSRRRRAGAAPRRPGRARRRPPRSGGRRRRCRARRQPGRAKPYVASRWSIISSSASRAATFRSMPASTGMPVVANERRAGRGRRLVTSGSGSGARRPGSRRSAR